MPKYELISEFEVQIDHNTHYVSSEKIYFERDNDKSAIKYAFHTALPDACANDKKLIKISPIGERIRIYEE